MTEDMTGFVLRFVRKVTEDQKAQWEVIVKNLQSNTERSFNQFAEAVQFMQSQLAQQAQPAGEGFKDFAGENFLAESAKMWGDFTSKYQELMLKAWEDAITSGPRMQQAMMKALDAWHLPNRNDQEATVRALEGLIARLDELSAKVDRLEKQVGG